MCGFAGIINPEGVDPSRLDAMTDALAHRGPDDRGVYLHGQAGLGHRRLSIIDLGGGHQPIHNDDRSVTIVFNGEIYNFAELRPDLEAKGFHFRTNSDTEVLLRAYEAYGIDCIKKLRGMFGFAIWDANRKRLFAARDHLGQKPIFYSEVNGRFLIGSEIKALLATEPSLRRMDLEALDQYLTLRLIAPPRSMFQNVRKLPPAHYLTYSPEQGLEVQRYWAPSYEPKWEGSDDELIQQTEEQILDSIEHHMVADVPVGAFLSGGLDSTLVVAMARAHGLAPDLQTFSFGLPYGEFDEAPAAKLVATKYGTNHYEWTITPSLLDLFADLLFHLDEPSDPLSVCQYMISERASKHVKVVLGGEGGDELFAGYDRYYGNTYTDYYAGIPSVIRRYGIGAALGLMPDGAWYKSKMHQLKWVHHLSFHTGGSRYAKSLGYFYFKQPLRSELYGPAMLKAQADQGYDPEAAIREPFEAADAALPVDRMLYADAQVRLPDHPVMILDRMTMAHGLEARAPFMDHKLAEFAARLPARMKLRGQTTRWVQRRLAEKYLPEELLTRPKQGFASALAYMLKNDYTRMFEGFLRDAALAQAGVYRQEAIDQLMSQHLRGRADHGNRLWLLLNSELWYRMHEQGVSRDALAEQLLRLSHASAPAA